MKKKTKNSILIALGLTCCVSVGFGAACAVGGENSIVLTEGKTQYVVDYGEWFDIPEATVNTDAKVEYTVTDESGAPVKLYNGRFKPSIGSFTITYQAEGFDDVVVTMNCKDDAAPTFSLESFVYGAVSGDVLDVPTFILEDPSGVNYDKTEISVYYGEQRTPVEIVDGKYTVDNAGLYSVEVYIEDTLGNHTVVVNEVTVSGAFVDTQLAKTTLMDFDENEYVNIIYPALGYDEIPMSIEKNNLPKDEEGNDSTGGMLKFPAFHLPSANSSLPRWARSRCSNSVWRR